MAFRGRDVAEKEMGHLFDDFRGALTAAAQHFWVKYQDDAHIFTTICRANIMRCLIANELKKALDGRPGIKIIEGGQTTTICVGQNWVLKVHKFDEECHTAINDNQTSLALNDNDLGMALLPGMPETATVVFLGYIEIIGDHLNPEMRLSCPDGAKPAWIIDLGEPPPLPPADISKGGDGGSDGGTKVVVKPKKDKKSNS
jgi:hypothetical protein